MGRGTGSHGRKRASVAFYAGRMMKSLRKHQLLSHSEASKDPLYHRNLVNFRQWGICLPLTSTKCRAAIVSAPKPRNRKEPEH